MTDRAKYIVNLKVTKWASLTGRISGLIISCLFLAFLVSEASDGLLKNAGEQFLKFLPLLALAIAGYIIAWFKPTIGGAVAILGGMLMLDFHLLRADLSTAAVYGVPFMIIGALFIASGRSVNPPKKNAS